MKLIDIIFDLIYSVRDEDVVEAEWRREKEEIKFIMDKYEDTPLLRARVDRIKRESTKNLPTIESQKHISSIKTISRKEVTYLFGIKLYDEVIIEKKVEYGGGGVDTFRLKN